MERCWRVSRVRLLVLAFLIAVGPFSTPGSAQTALEDALEGLVLDGRAERPLVDALVRQLGADSIVLRSTLTDLDGRFSLPTDARAVAIDVSAFGYGAERRDLGPEFVGEFRLLAVPFEVAGVEVAAAMQCDPGEDRVAAVALLDSITPVLLEVARNTRRDDLDYVMRFTRPEKTWNRGRYWFSPDTSLVAWDAAIPTVPVASYAEVGFARVVDDSTSAYLAPSAEFLASSAFRESHCFGFDTDGPTRRIYFSPKNDQGARVGISGSFDVGPAGELRRVEWRYENLEPFVSEYEVPQWEAAQRERHAEYENISFLPVVDRGETGGFMRLDEVEEYGPMIVEWEIRGVFVGSGGGEGKGENTRGLGLRYTFLTLRPAIRGLFATKAQLVALRPRVP